MLKKLITVLLLLVIRLSVQAVVLTGTIVDKETNEPLIGASIQVQNTGTGTVTDFDGNYSISDLDSKVTTFEIRYMGYKTLSQTIDLATTSVLNVALQSEGTALDEIVLAVKKNRASENVLAMERKISGVAVENIGAQEMSRKGASTVEDGVKKITGISIAEAGQVVVRGLGDRYSLTTLNGMPIASPNPDNKLIPLDLFPSSVINNITVNKVYSASQFADYSGAHIDISTSEHTGDNLTTIGIKIGASQYAVSNKMLMGQLGSSIFLSNNLSKDMWNMNKQDFEAALRAGNILNSDFNIRKMSYLPNMGIDVNTGQTWNLDAGELSLIASLGLDQSMEYLPDGFNKTLSADGTVLSEFDNDKYKQSVNTTALASISYNSNSNQSLAYTLLYARKAEHSFLERDGHDAEGINLKGSNSSFHVYNLLSNQVQGKHKVTDLWNIKWDAALGVTRSVEPDRKQVMYRKGDDGELSLFKLNAQETMRYFGDLKEWEALANTSAVYKYGKDEKSRLVFGGAFKYKNRNFRSMRMYYNLRGIDEGYIGDIYDKSAYLNQDNISNGTIIVKRDKQPKDSYIANMYSAALFAETDFFPVPFVLINFGLRGEYVRQSVDYFTDGGTPKKALLSTLDLFPAVNIKFEVKDSHILRASISRTVTRPSFIEMAPFLYQESYGGVEVRGNADLQNGYNYNFDVKYEWFISGKASELFAATVYFKYLDSPIERIQESSGGAAVHSFRNSNEGIATGVELEFKKRIVGNLNFGANFSYMYTNVKLPEGGGIYTSTSRALQGASPYLANADISYRPSLGEDHRFNFSLIYNLQGPRIHAVGIMGLGDVTQNVLHSLDFVASYELKNRLQFKFNVKNIINNDFTYKQDIPLVGKSQIVELRKRPIEASISISYKLFNE